MPSLSVRLLRTGPVAEVELQPGDSTVPLSTFHDEFEQTVAAIHGDESVRVVLITSRSDAFACPPRPHGAVPPVPAPLPFRSLELLPQPVIACIEGEATGAGLELALACDIRIASSAATFSLPQAAEGRIAADGGTQRLPRVAGRAVAAEMLLAGTVLDAAAALACGLVNDAVPPGTTRTRAGQLAARIIERAPLAVRYAKEAIVRGLDMPLAEALRYETDLTIILQTTEDRAEGVRAFLEKRPPRFQGR